jgi:hypothetical protein
VEEAERGASGQLRVVCTNVSFPTGHGFPALKTERVVRWPDKDPLFAIVGVMGAKICPKKADFVAPEKAIEEVRASGGLEGALRLIVLSHDDRDRDIALLDALDAGTVAGPSFVYLLGGHDHHVNWSEMPARGPKGCAVFSKCLSNGRSLRIFLVSRSQLAVDQVRRLEHWDSTTRANVIASLSRRYLGSKGAYFSALVAQAKDWESFCRSVDPSRLTGDAFVRLGADALWSVEPAKHHVAWTASFTAGRAPAKVLVERTSLIDATDKSTRGGPTPLGTFVTQCVRAGMKADIAIVHAGSFRGDDHFGPNLDTHTLEDIFVYDGRPTEWTRKDGSTVWVQPIIRIPMRRDALRAFLAHGRGKRDDGGYPRVVRSRVEH